jgi:hypothetical protein
MAKGRSKARVHDVFRTNVTGLQTDARNIEQSVLGQDQRNWQIEPVRGWSGDPLDIAGVGDKFDRSEIHSNYTECLSDTKNSGTAADTQALTLQNDWLAMQERAFRLRHATSVRCALHAAGRRKAHEHEKGVLAAGVLKYIEDVIKRGA